jgi:hypothetical protein
MKVAGRNLLHPNYLRCVLQAQLYAAIFADQNEAERISRYGKVIAYRFGILSV